MWGQPPQKPSPNMPSTHSNIAGKIFRKVTGVGCLLLALLMAFAGMFAAFGGPDGKFGSRESIHWAIGYAAGFLVFAAASWWLLRSRPERERH